MQVLLNKFPGPTKCRAVEKISCRLAIPLESSVNSDRESCNRRVGKYKADTGKKVHAFYFVLEKYGYKMSDEEREVVCGTSDLYERYENDEKK